jgi:hypothetical protein
MGVGCPIAREIGGRRKLSSLVILTEVAQGIENTIEQEREVKNVMETERGIGIQRIRRKLEERTERRTGRRTRTGKEIEPEIVRENESVVLLEAKVDEKIGIVESGLGAERTRSGGEVKTEVGMTQVILMSRVISKAVAVVVVA